MHEEGFHQAIRHVTFFDYIPTGEGKFDISKDVHESQLVLVNDIPSSRGDDNDATNQ